MNASAREPIVYETDEYINLDHQDSDSGDVNDQYPLQDFPLLRNDYGRHHVHVTPNRSLEVVRISIGEIHISRKPVLIYTLLGSCVAVCLQDPLSRIGGMNHILLPGKADVKHFNTSARYGINAMELLINGMMKMGAKRQRLQAKIFGGGHVIPAISAGNNTGKMNIGFVRQFLATEGIPIISSDVGGHDTRRIFMDTESFQVYMKRSRIQDWFNRAVDRCLPTLPEDMEESGDITLFRQSG